mmetsp:Transcript_12260/g.29984  ORF Transcript_12260/g.29984 Transcript_12260/m.29984 type:complete len:259 (+) Transcript_12260:875-1651(+)
MLSSHCVRFSKISLLSTLSGAAALMWCVKLRYRSALRYLRLARSCRPAPKCWFPTSLIASATSTTSLSVLKAGSCMAGCTAYPSLVTGSSSSFTDCSWSSWSSCDLWAPSLSSGIVWVFLNECIVASILDLSFDCRVLYSWHSLNQPAELDMSERHRSRRLKTSPSLSYERPKKASPSTGPAREVVPHISCVARSLYGRPLATPLSSTYMVTDTWPYSGSGGSSVTISTLSAPMMSSAAGWCRMLSPSGPRSTFLSFM